MESRSTVSGRTGQSAVKGVARGRVQRVGFRRYVLDLAQEMGIAGYVKNLKDGSVELFAQGEGAGLAEFLNRARNLPPPVRVKELAVEDVPVDPSLTSFVVSYGSLEDELQEGFGAMQAEFGDYRDEFRSYVGEFRDYRNEFKDYRDEFRGFAKRTDDNFKSLGERYGEISEKLTLVLETLQKESAETRRELTRAVDNLARLVDEYVKLQRKR